MYWCNVNIDIKILIDYIIWYCYKNYSRFKFVNFYFYFIDVILLKFSNCLNMLFYVDKMEVIKFDFLIVSDNSGLVKNVIVMFYNFKLGIVVFEDVNVIYIVVDNSGNLVICIILFIIKGIKI